MRRALPPLCRGAVAAFAYNLLPASSLECADNRAADGNWSGITQFQGVERWEQLPRSVGGSAHTDDRLAFRWFAEE